MSLVSNLQGTYTRLLGIPDRLGVPFYESVQILLRGSTSPVNLTPRPQVLRVTPRALKAYLDSSVDALITDLVLEPVPRGLYTYDQLRTATWAVRGQRYQTLYVEEGLMAFKILIRELRVR